MNALEVIGRKRDGEEHTREEIAFLLHGYLGGSIPDYQVAAWLMAVCCHGLDRQELADLTDLMATSGRAASTTGTKPGPARTTAAPLSFRM